MTCQQTATCQWSPSGRHRNRYTIAAWHWAGMGDLMRPSERPGFASLAIPSGVGHCFERWVSDGPIDNYVVDTVITERPLEDGEIVERGPYYCDRRDWFDPSLACSQWPTENDALIVPECPNGCGEL